MNTNILDIKHDSELPSSGSLRAVKIPYQTPSLTNHGQLKAVTMTGTGNMTVPTEPGAAGDTEVLTGP